MKVFLQLSIGLSFVVALFAISCRKQPCETCTEKNQPPIAKAGDDQTILLPKDSVVLDGSASSDPDGSIAQYKWIKIDGPASSVFANVNVAKTTVRTLVAGVYSFELTVTDNDRLSAKDTIQVMVIAPHNQPPIACAGSDQIITLPNNTVTLDANCSVSADPENKIQNYLWTKIAGPAPFSIANAGSVQTQVTNLVEGSYQFQLKITDYGGLFSYDTIQVIVLYVSEAAVDVFIAGEENGVAKYWKNGQ